MPASPSGTQEAAVREALSGTSDTGKKPVSPQDKKEIADRIAVVRGMLEQIERDNAQPLVESTKKRFIRVRAPSEEQLDSIYGALTKMADSFPPDSAAGDAFRDEAQEFIHSFRMYERPGRLLSVFKEDPFLAKQLDIIEYVEPNAEVKVSESGAIEINSDGVNLSHLLNWDVADSPARQRYGHLFTEDK
jgi:hypothetical protein